MKIYEVGWRNANYMRVISVIIYYHFDPDDIKIDLSNFSISPNQLVQFN